MTTSADEKRTGRRPRRDWRLGGRAVRLWDSSVLAVCLLGLGGGLLLSPIMSQSSLGNIPQIALISLWVGLASGIYFAVARARPASLFSFRSHDLVWAAGMAVTLRLVHGLTPDYLSTPFPTVLTGSTKIPEWMTTYAMPVGLIGPIIEELFFRAVLLVSVYQAVRCKSNQLVASVAAVAASSASFVALHAIFSELDATEIFDLALIGVVFSLSVLLTGRVWPAVLAHVLFNLSFIALMLAGNIWGA